MRTIFTAAAVAPALALASPTAPALAQSPSDIVSVGKDAASAITSQAKNALLVGDLLGSKVMGPSGEPAGTIKNLVAIPGGRLVAVLVEPNDGGRPVPVPYKLITVQSKAATIAAHLPRPLSELAASPELKALRDAVGGLVGGN